MAKFYIEIKDSGIGETTITVLTHPSEFEKPSNAKDVTMKIMDFVDNTFNIKPEPILMGKIIKA